MDIFDTSAIRSIGRVALAGITSSREIFDSPISAYELLCHLDEKLDKKITDPQGVFEKRKGELLKLKMCRTLDDPHAAHAVAIGATAITNPTRFEDALLLPSLIAELENSATLREFYGRTIVDTSGSTRTIADCAARARAALGAEEQRFAELIGITGADLKRKLDANGSKDFSNSELFAEIRLWCEKLVEGYNGDGIDHPDLAKTVFSSIYLHYGYIIARTLSYLQKGDVRYDVNDMEDGVICLHLAIDHEDTLVTNDGGTREALERVITAFNQNSGELARCRCMTLTDYLQETGSDSGVSKR